MTKLNLAITQQHTDFDRAFDLAAKELGDIGDKTGFDLYRHYRDFLINIFSSQHKTETMTSAKSCSAALSGFNLCDKAYIDNFILSLTIKLKAPEAYGDALATIDKYVRPAKRNEGLNHFFQEIGGYLALLLTRQEQLSERQALRLAAYLVGYSESMVEARYREQKKKVNPQELTQPPHITALLALFWTLQKVNRDLSGLQPLKKHARSADELLKAKRAYASLSRKTVERFHPKLKEYLKRNPRSILLTAQGDYGVDLNRPDANAHFHVFVLLCCAFALEYMPGVLESFERQYITTAPAEN